MSSSTGEEKSFSATPSHIAKARREGNRPQSAQLQAVVACSAAALVFPHVANQIACGVSRWLAHMGSTGLLHIRSTPGGLDELPTGLPAYSSIIAQAAPLVGVCAALIMISGAGAITIAGITGSAGIHALRFDVRRLSPSAGFKRIFSRESGMQAVRGFALLLLSLLVAGVILALYSVAMGNGLTFSHLLIVVTTVLGDQVKSIVAIGFAFALIDTLTARQAWLRGLKMSFTELKAEHREQHGDIHQRSRRKQQHRRMLRERKKAIRNATVVITNPTHLSIALLYAPPDIGVPVVVARGADDEAMLIRRLAGEAGVPIVESKPLARLLFARADEGEPIPVESYTLVAALLATLNL